MLAGLFSPRVYEPYTRIYSPHMPNQRFFLVMQGSLVASHRHAGSTPLYVLPPTSSWGSANLLSPHARYPYVLTTGNNETILEEVSIAQLLKYLGTYPSLKQHVIAAAAREHIEHLYRHEQNISILYTLTELLNDQSLDDDDLWDALLAALCDYLGAEKALIAQFNSIPGHVAITHDSGFHPSLRHTHIPFHLDTMLSSLIHTQSPLIITNNNYEPKYDLVPYTRPTMAALPLLHGSHIYGALLFADLTSDATVQKIRFLSSLTNLITSRLIQDEGNKERIFTEKLKRPIDNY